MNISIKTPYDHTINLDLKILFEMYSKELSVLATEVIPIIIDKDNRILDDQALADYRSFVENVMEILDYYDFVVIDEVSRRSPSFPYTSEYRWVARREEIKSGDVPKYIRLRISDHIENQSKEVAQKQKAKEKAEADQIKLPESKLKQRFKVKEIIINQTVCETYEEALSIVEKIIFEWMQESNIDVSQYEPLGF